MSLRTFELHRREDFTGVSGTGIVAEGVVFSDGRCAYRWCGELATTVTADCIEDVDRIHGHEGRTRIVWTGAGHA